MYSAQCIKRQAVVVSCERATTLRRHDERGRGEEKEHEDKGELGMQTEGKTLKARTPLLRDAGKHRQNNYSEDA